MIRALLTGVLYGAPEPRTAKSGKAFVTGKLRADDGKGGSVFCSLVAFNEQADRLALLPAGAALSVSGKAEVQAWTGKDGNPAAGLSVVVDDLAALKPKPRPRTAPALAPAGFDDDLAFGES
jgi:single-stranded DNA-binding protein